MTFEVCAPQPTDPRGARAGSAPASRAPTTTSPRRAGVDVAAVVRASRRLAAAVLPSGLRERMRAILGRPHAPRPGAVSFGDLRRVSPIGRKWGKDRGGLPIDRHYIERFLAAHAADVRGRVLEVGDNRYTMKYGAGAVERSDVLHVHAGAPGATIVDDLVVGSRLPTESFDCVILTQVVHLIADPASAMRTAYRILKPGGVLLVSLAGISQISTWDMERWGDYWRFTTRAAEHLATNACPGADVVADAHGNVLAAICFLHGLAANELDPAELAHRDAEFQLVVTIRVTKPQAP